VPRFRVGPFLISPAHRAFRRYGTPIPIIPRYFDLLVLLLANRHRVVTRQEIFDRVWADVVVSDGALTQAIRTLRRSLGDDPRDPQFIRTVSRHGYQFVGAGVTEESDDGPLPTAGGAAAEATPRAEDRFTANLDRLLRRRTHEAATDEDRREAAEELHALGTAEALARLDALPGQAEARAMLRDARWDVPGAGDVPLLRSPRPWASIAALVSLRLRRAARHASNRWGAAAIGGTTAGFLAGMAGGVALWIVPESEAGPDVIVALAVIGAAAGAIGTAGVGAGLAGAETLARSARARALAVCGAAGGAIAGAVAHAIARAVISGVFGRELDRIGGALEGIVLGGAAGLGYALSTRTLPGGGLAGPRGRARTRTVIATGAACALAALLLTLGGRPLVASSLDAMAAAFQGSDVGLAPLARLLGEGELRPVTRALVSAFEGLLFGAGLAFGLTHRPGPRPRPSARPRI
jgi:DNA-binding winged helix-turn-helix (wHTH) protein